ncbi:Ribosome associated membrane protein RAMP4 [Klebsormidium nitens]|uniref:Ribosome associated membrane protein RAMP4 n=1 Tax=Klebsormidium nitens TaxID=105231 RepID=A0A1Y1IIN1_KLENI|nr:Ribosome associated membrane protein RAMP4 [Klebsormidium nitens]|eukprot:GAQ88028.1 Ribosome associated membrane protein RAMP4 [Klebsormidium nitens]
MTVSTRHTKVKSDKFQKNILKRGEVPKTSKKEAKYPVGPIVLGFFLFVVVGSAILQIIRQAQSGAPVG